MPDDTTWNAFTTEVSVDVTGAYPSWGFDESVSGPISRGFGFTLTRSLPASGIWASVVTFDPFAPVNAPVRPGQYDPGISRVETDDAKSYFRMYSTSGALMVPTMPDTSPVRPQPGIDPLPSIPGSFPRHPSSPGGPMPLPSVSSTRQRAQAATASRDWIDYFIVGSGARDRIRRQLTLASQSVSTTAAGRDRFVIVQKDTRLETEIDPRDGAPLQVSTYEGGVLRTRETRSYAAYGEGARALRSSRVEYFTPGQQKATMALQTTFDHTLLSRSAER